MTSRSVPRCGCNRSSESAAGIVVYGMRISTNSRSARFLVAGACTAAVSCLQHPMQAAPARSSSPDTTIVSGAVGARLDSMMRHLEDSSFAGTVLVVIRATPVLLKGYGYADLARGIRNGPATLFDFASITKTVTGAAILSLDAAKRLSVNEPVADFVGSVDAAKAEATIDQLAKHTSGFVVAGTDVGDSSRAGFMQKMRVAPTESPPGANYRYSNAGFSLLAAIVEQRAGMPFADYVRRTLFEPSGFTGGFRWEPAWDARRARGYGGKPGEPAREITAPVLHWGSIGATGWIGTVSDVYRFSTALRHGGLVPPAELRRTRDSTTTEAYGWHYEPTSRFGERVIHKGGDFPGFQSQILYFPDREITIVWANNDQRIRWRDRLNTGLSAIALSSR